jgi:hypothetical protein
MRKRLVLTSILLVFIFILSLSAVRAQNGTTCPGSLPARLTIGLVARVLPGDANNVRDQASRSGAIVGQIPGNMTFAVLEGPACADDLTWYRVDYNGIIGWTVEGAGDEYFLEPLEVDVTPTPSATATPIPSSTPIPSPTLSPTPTVYVSPTPAPTLTPSATPTPIPVLVNPFINPQAPVQNTLKIGAEVLTNSTLNDLVQVRSTPGLVGAEVIKLPAGETLRITDGPVEQDGYRWWQIERLDGLVGWVAEGIQERGRFLPLLLPLCPADIADQAELLVIQHDEASGMRNLYTATSDQTLLCNLSYASGLWPMETAGRVFARWSPDGSQIVTNIGGLTVLNADGSGRHSVTNNIEGLEAAWSASGTYIAYTASLPEQESRHLWVVQPDGTGIRVLTSGYTINDLIRWSPIEDRLVYRQYPPALEPTTTTLGFIGADVSQPRSFELLWVPAALNWSPDATKVAMVLRRTNALIEIDVESGEQTTLATITDIAQAVDVMWMPDAQSILVLGHDSEAVNKLIRVDVESGEQTVTAYSQQCQGSDGKLSVNAEGNILISGGMCSAIVDLAGDSVEYLFENSDAFVDFRPVR